MRGPGRTPLLMRQDKPDQLPTSAHTIFPLPVAARSHPYRSVRASTIVRPRPLSSSRPGWFGAGSVTFSSHTSTSAARRSVESRRWIQAKGSAEVFAVSPGLRHALDK